jgi:hypothetical protein
VAGADLRAALVASCLRGAFPPVDLRAVCLVRAILNDFFDKFVCIKNIFYERRVLFGFWFVIFSKKYLFMFFFSFSTYPCRIKHAGLSPNIKSWRNYPRHDYKEKMSKFKVRA